MIVGVLLLLITLSHCCVSNLYVLCLMAGWAQAPNTEQALPGPCPCEVRKPGMKVQAHGSRREVSSVGGGLLE